MRARASLNPFRLWRQGWHWHGRTTRGQYLVYLLCYIAVVSVGLWLAGTGQLSQWRRAVFLFAAAAMVVPFFGLALRRLSDMGRTGWWAWLLLVPWVNLATHVALCALRPSDTPRHGSPGLRRAGLVLSLGLAALVLSRLFWAPFTIPAGSMKPTLLVGDYLISTSQREAPERGDVVIFRHPVTGADFVKRVIALPSDTVQLRGGVVHLNGAALPQAALPDFTETMAPQGPNRTLPRCANGPVAAGAPCLKRQFTETLPSGRSYRVLDIGPSPADDTPLLTVPQAHVFVLGDNRDNAVDSRFPSSRGGVGFVPLANIDHRARLIAFSHAGGSPAMVWTWATDRLLKSLP